MLVSSLLFHLISAPDLVADLREPYLKIAKEGYRGSVLIGENGKVILHEGFGKRGDSTPDPMPADAVVPIGSVAKFFTGVTVLKLIGDGKVSLETPLNKLFSGVPGDKAQITVKQLLAHTAGFSEYLDRPGEGGDFAPLSKAEALKRAFAEKLRFTPGSKTEYSNNGYVLLAAIVEKVTGGTFEDAVRRFVIKPAGLKSTGFYGEAVASSGRFAIGSGAKTRGKPNTSLNWGKTTWALMGSGGIVSTVDDMGRLIRAITQGKVVSSRFEPRLFEPLSGPEGYGWMVGRTAKGTPFCNVGGGDDYGFNAAILYMPREGRLIVSCSAGDTPMKVQNANRAALLRLAKPNTGS